MKRVLSTLAGLLFAATTTYAQDFPTTVFDATAFKADIDGEGRVRRRHMDELADEMGAVQTELGAAMVGVLEPGEAPDATSIDNKGELFVGTADDTVGIFSPCGDGLVMKGLAASGTGWTCSADNGTPVILDLADDASNESTMIGEIATTGDTNAIVSEPAADKVLFDMGLNWPTADLADGLSAGAIAAVTAFNAALCANDEIIKKTGGTWQCDTAGGGGSSIVLDLADDASDESVALGEIATTGDTNNIFTEPAADKLLVDLGLNWPSADTADALSADPADCAANQFATTIAASGALTCAALVDADVPNTITIDLAAAATALAADPADCAANEFATTIAASGALTCAALVDADVPDTITASSYLPLTGGTLTGQLVADNLGVELEDSDTNPSCAAGNYTIYADLSETTLKKCVNGTVSDLDTTAAGSGDAAEVEDGDDAGTFSSIDTTARFEDQGDVNFAITDGGAGGPDAITATIRADKILESHLKAVDAAADEECLTYETTTGDFEWQACGGGSGHTIEDEGTPLTARTGLNFTGAGVTCTDDAGGDETDCDIPGGGGSGTASFGSTWEPSAPPVTAGSEDDEFDDAEGAGAPTGWTEYDIDAGLTVTEANGFVEMSGSATGIAGIYKDIPSGDFSIWTKMSMSGPHTETTVLGLGLMEDPTSSTADVGVFGIHVGAGTALDYRLRVEQAQNQDWSVGINKKDTGLGTAGARNKDLWLRIRRTGTTYDFDFSWDGIGWEEFIGGVTFSVTPTKFGPIYLSDEASARARFQFFRYEDSDVGPEGLAKGREVAYFAKDATASGGTAAYASKWDADAPPVTAGAYDDEFDDASLDADWTEVDPNADATVTEVSGNVFFEVPTSTANGYAGIARDLGGDASFTITTKLNLSMAFGAAHVAAVTIWEDASTSSTDYLVCRAHLAGSVIGMYKYDSHGDTTGTLLGTERTVPGLDELESVYLRIRQASATSIACDYSVDGVAWTGIDTAENPGFTAADGGVSIGTYDADVGLRVEWFRFQDSDVGIHGLAPGAEIALFEKGAVAGSGLSGSASVDFGATAANSCEESAAITVTGAVDGDACAVGVPATLGDESGAIFSCYVSAANAVKAKRCNVTGSALTDEASATVNVRVLQ